MSLDFAIIPFNENYLAVAKDIETKLTNATKLKLNLVIDDNYDQTFISRMNKWKKMEYDIVGIDQYYEEYNCVVVRFSDKDSKPQNMEINDFIELIASFDDEDDVGEAETKQDAESDDAEEFCRIM
jgi:hypothetical protein